MRIVRRRRAVEDIDEHAAYIAQRNPQAAYRFLENLEQTLETLSQHPRIGSPRLQYLASGLRAWPVLAFEAYIILYFVVRSAVQIVRVVHASRDLEPLFKGPWTERRS